ncbi:class F sortase [Streptomyces flavalbus]|uniref:Class F sortase n=1 Tax=Streptomyces flavalbus TaxID=2665155 RepID=A0ABW2WHL4_9ACTN
MTALSRRAFALAALTTPLAGCGGPPAGRGARTPPGTRTPANSASPTGRPVPVRLRVPAIGVDTPLIRLGLAPDGTVEVPPVTAHDRAGWYEHSPAPGQTGPSVILGHVTVGRYGDGVFRHLSALRRGAGVVARLEDGTEVAFTVTSVRTVAKARFPTDDVYGDVGAPELRLVTCGGQRTADGYPDNVIVFATLDATGPGN